MAMTLITLSGTFVDPQPGGTTTPAAGNVTAKANQPMVDTSVPVTYEPTLLTATLNGSGFATMQVPATDDSTTLPTGTEYLITLNITGQPVRSVSVPLPHATTSVDIGSLFD